MLELGSIYIAGLLTFFSPCVLPIIPGYLGILAQGKADNKKLMFKNAALFCIGFVSLFTALGFLSGVFNQFVKSHTGTINLVAGIVILIFALKFIGVIEIPFLDMKQGQVKTINTRFKAFNSFLFGILFAATWSPCIGPILGSILTYTAASTSSTWWGATQLLIFGLGLSTPMLASVFFYEKIVSSLRSNKFFLPMLHKTLGVLLIFVALSMFEQVGNVSPIKINGKVNSDMVSNDKDQLCKTVLQLGELPMLIDLYSKNCIICQQMEPTINTLKKACGGTLIDFKAIDLSDTDNSWIAFHLAAYGTPTYILVDKTGKEFARTTGSHPIQELDNLIRDLTGSSCLALGRELGIKIDEHDTHDGHVHAHDHKGHL